MTAALPHVLLAGSSNPLLAGRIADALGERLGRREITPFPDGELHIELLESVRGRNVFLLQSTAPPVGQHLLELLLLADACRRDGAAHLTTIVPYYGYARQDRRAHGREAVGARLVADLMHAAGLARAVAIDLHSDALEGFFAMPLEHLSAVPLLAEAVRPLLPTEAIIVAPDVGAARLAERYARHLDRPVAIVHKARLSGTDVRVTRITGDIQGRVPVIVDDMISTGATVVAAAERLKTLPLRRLLVTDTVALPPDVPLPLETTSVAPLLAATIARLDDARPLHDLIGRD